MSDLPPGWEWATLGEIGNYINGRAFKESDWSTEGRPIVRIQNLTGTGKKFHHFSGVLDENHITRSGDLLISWAATLGSYVWRGPEAAINQHIFKVRSKIDVGFHYHLVDHLISQLYSRAQGSGIIHVTRGKFENLDFILPPLAEQRRIVAALEDHLSRLDAATRSLASARRRLAMLVGAVRNSEIGDLTGSTLGCLADVIDRIEAGRSFGGSARPAAEDEWGIIKVSAMTWGEFRPSENKFVPEDGRIDPRYEIMPGDILISRANTEQYVGAPVLVRTTRPKLLLSDKSLRLKPKSHIDRNWLIEVLASPLVRRQISEKATGTKDSMRNISQASLREVRIPLHDSGRQCEIVAALSERHEAIQRLDSDLATVATLRAKLRRALLADAFTGRLVPQDPGDEPASVLLERIRAERAAQPKPKRTRRTKQADITQEALL
jgi:type I restriction enzyme, S subunit